MMQRQDYRFLIQTMGWMAPLTHMTQMGGQVLRKKSLNFDLHLLQLGTLVLMSGRQFEILVQSTWEKRAKLDWELLANGWQCKTWGWIRSSRKKEKKKKKQSSREFGENQETGVSWKLGKKMSMKEEVSFWLSNWEHLTPLATAVLVYVTEI